MAYKTPQIVEIMHRETLIINTRPNETLGNECPTEGIDANAFVRHEQWAYLAILSNSSPLHAESL
jgi:hypothetical protein